MWKGKSLWLGYTVKGKPIVAKKHSAMLLRYCLCIFKLQSEALPCDFFSMAWCTSHSTLLLFDQVVLSWSHTLSETLIHCHSGHGGPHLPVAMLKKDLIRQIDVFHSERKNFSKRQTRHAACYSELAFNICLTLYTPRVQKPCRRRKLALEIAFFIKGQDLHMLIHFPFKVNNNN